MVTANELLKCGGKLPADLVQKQIKYKPAPQTEKEIQKQCVDWLRIKGYYCVKIHQSLGSFRGIADYWIIGPYYHGWIEFKTAKGVQSDYQKEFQCQVVSHGGQYKVIRSLEEIMRMLGGAQNGQG
jgi:hypothetical protein